MSSSHNTPEQAWELLYQPECGQQDTLVSPVSRIPRQGHITAVKPQTVSSDAGAQGMTYILHLLTPCQFVGRPDSA